MPHPLLDFPAWFLVHYFEWTVVLAMLGKGDQRRGHSRCGDPFRCFRDIARASGSAPHAETDEAWPLPAIQIGISVNRFGLNCGV